MKNILFLFFGIIFLCSIANAMTEVECICFLECQENLLYAINSITDKAKIKRFTVVYVFSISPEFIGGFTTNDEDFNEPQRLDGYDNCYYKDYLHPINAFRVCMYYTETG